MDELSIKKINKTVRLIKSITDISAEMELSAITLNCLLKIRQRLDIVHWAAIGFLNELGIITSCEGDVYGMLGACFLTQLSSSPALLMDLVNFDENDHSLLFLHCGVDSTGLAYKRYVKLASHFNHVETSGYCIIKHAFVDDMIYKKAKKRLQELQKKIQGSFFLVANLLVIKKQVLFDVEVG